jgi:hypothetical protein
MLILKEELGELKQEMRAIQERMTKMDDRISLRREFSLLFSSTFDSDSSTATYSQCILNHPIITLVEGDYKHFHLNESGRFFFFDFSSRVL